MGDARSALRRHDSGRPPSPSPGTRAVRRRSAPPLAPASGARAGATGRDASRNPVRGTMSVAAAVAGDPAPDVLGTPDGHPLGQLDGLGKRARLDAPPQRGFGDGYERQHLRLAQEAGFGQVEWGRPYARWCRGPGSSEEWMHDRALSRLMPAKVMTTSDAAAQGQVSASRWGTPNSTTRRARPGNTAWKVCNERLRNRQSRLPATNEVGWPATRLRNAKTRRPAAQEAGIDCDAARR
jgi:hypothetical protein